ncbi:MAG: leucine-rich repeat domain-containing protein [Clostridiales bacterium]|nr:leucine-rich repeat domain-containing protein [Clostridiales bacterium]
MKNSFVAGAVSGLVAVSTALSVLGVYGSCVSAAEGIAINELNFPDQNFRTYISDNFDKSEPKDRFLSQEELAAVTKINIDRGSVFDLTGIGYFTELTNLNAEANVLASVDLSKNVNLRFAKISHSQVKKIDLSGCKALEEIDLSYNYLTELDVSGCPAMRKLEADKNSITSLNIKGCTVLKELHLFDNRLREIDVTGSPKINTLDVGGNRLTSIDLSKSVDLMALWSDGNSIDSIDISASSYLRNVVNKGEIKTYTQTIGENTYEFYEIRYNGMFITYNPDTKVGIGRTVEELFPDENFRKFVSENYDTDHDGFLTQRELNTVREINVSNQGISDLTGIEHFPYIETLVCYGNDLRSVDVSKNTKLKILQCNDNKITDIDVSGCPELIALIAMKNKLDGIDVSNNPKLELMMLGDNNIVRLDVSSNKNLNFLEIYDNNITELDIKYNKYLTDLYANGDMEKLTYVSGQDSIEYIDYSNNDSKHLSFDTDVAIECGLKISEVFPDENFRKYVLSDIDTDHNGFLTPEEIEAVTAIDVRKLGITDLTGIEIFTNLEKLDCSSNNIKSLDVSGNTALKELDCSKNGMTDLDVSGCSELEKLNCSDNKLTELDVSKNPNLTYLDCSNNELDELDVSKNKDLTYLDCSNNNLEELDLKENKDLVTVICDGNDIDKVYAPDGPVEVTADDDTIVLKLSKDSWHYEGVVWSGSEVAGYEANAYYSCTIKGEEALTIYKKMTVIKNHTLPTCDKNGVSVYTASIAASDSEDGKDHQETKTVTVNAKGHMWGDWEITKNATLEAEGEKVHTCFVCGKTETAKIAKLGQTGTSDPATSAADTGSKAGTAAADKNTTGKASVTAVQPAKNAKVSLVLDKASGSVVCGKSLSLKATLKESAEKITWKSSNTKIATVDASGKVKGKMAGTVTITASAAGKTATCKVTVLYKDVTNSKDFWFVPTNHLTAEGVVKGYDNQTNFKPANECTRAQMVTFIWRLMGEPAPKTKVCKFSDVKKTDYYYKACLWGNENHIVEGYKNGTFGPKIVCARRHAVTFLWRLAGQPAPKTKTNKFSDVKKNDYFYKATLWASETGILAGYSDGTFRPDGDCLRRQMVTFLYKYEKFANKK